MTLALAAYQAVAQPELREKILELGVGETRKALAGDPRVTAQVVNRAIEGRGDKATAETCAKLLDHHPNLSPDLALLQAVQAAGATEAVAAAALAVVDVSKLDPWSARFLEQVRESDLGRSPWALKQAVRVSDSLTYLAAASESEQLELFLSDLPGSGPEIRLLEKLVELPEPKNLLNLVGRYQRARREGWSPERCVVALLEEVPSAARREALPCLVYALPVGAARSFLAELGEKTQRDLHYPARVALEYQRESQLPPRLALALGACQACSEDHQALLEGIPLSSTDPVQKMIGLLRDDPQAGDSVAALSRGVALQRSPESLLFDVLHRYPVEGQSRLIASMVSLLGSALEPSLKEFLLALAEVGEVVNSLEALEGPYQPPLQVASGGLKSLTGEAGNQALEAALDGCLEQTVPVQFFRRLLQETDDDAVGRAAGNALCQEPDPALPQALFLLDQSLRYLDVENRRQVTEVAVEIGEH